MTQSTTHHTARPAGLDEHTRLSDQALALKELMHGHIVHAPIKNPKLILDVCCGTGIVTRELGRRFPSARVIGIDTSKVVVEDGDDKPENVTFIEGSLHDLAGRHELLAPGTFDYIFSRLLIVRMTNWESYIRAVATLLRPGGYFEVQDTTHTIYQINEWGDTDTISGKWKWLSFAVFEARRHDLEPLCGEYAQRWMGHAGLVDVERMEYVLPFGTWDVKDRPESRRIGEHMARYQPVVYRYLLRGFLRNRPDVSEDNVDDMLDQCQKDLKAEEGKHRVLYVTIGMKAF